ncbi:MAG: tRNA pseudouridine(54/55) synthase Pus10 [Canidatus Methanoxibalbensis ujae]|nr:tRNA pseudouridine(54/55) synthase Pus10 [Candidatus Methanoxibalbensis ujae]MCW7078837.1 tRNA pseudouridine(54/55) synthase Pus10 [Candidatus Methanoxibalbensis ujae]
MEGDLKRGRDAMLKDTFADPEILEKAREILHALEGHICDNCLGRQFAKIYSGISNRERGRILRHLMRSGDVGDVTCDVTDAKAAEKSGECYVCNGIFERLDDFVQKALSALQQYEFNSFLVGTKISGSIAQSEEMIWDITGAEYAEPLKAELNREVGKRISHLTGKKADFRRPDIVIILNLWTNEVELQVNPIFVYGRYRKLKRGIPQTRWPCKKCWGKGCERCGYTGKMYAESVEELIKDVFKDAFLCDDMIMHGAGREDIDARMLGNGRPFVAEVRVPRRRSIDLRKLERSVNERCAGKVEVFCLRFVEHDFVERVKNARGDKTYRVIVCAEGSFDKESLDAAVQRLKGKIEQRTPRRVVHRRADTVRVREVKDVRISRILNAARIADLPATSASERAGDAVNGVTVESCGKRSDKTVFEMEVRCEGGLYVKELVSGDDGRTKPSLSEILGTDASVIALDVVDVHLYFGDEECLSEHLRRSNIR